MDMKDPLKFWKCAIIDLSNGYIGVYVCKINQAVDFILAHFTVCFITILKIMKGKRSYGC